MVGDGGSVNFVAHGTGFITGFAVGVFARLTGTLLRYEKLANGDTWWGYLPARLDDEAARAARVERRRQRLLEESRRG